MHHRLTPYLAAAALGAAGVASSASAVESVAVAPVAAEQLTVDFGTGSISRNTPTVVYTNLDPTGALRAFGSGDLSATFGDDLDLVVGGELTDFQFTVFNSNGAGNTGLLDTFDAEISFFDGAGTFIDSFTSSFDFTTPLTPGGFGLLSVTNLGGLDIDLPEDVIVTQQLSNITGGTTQIGVVSSNPVTVGSAEDTLFIDASDVGSGPGFFNITSMGQPSPFFAGYSVTVIPVPEPTTAGLFGLGAVAFLRRRR
jgi:hypothetical protein